MTDTDTLAYVATSADRLTRTADKRLDSIMEAIEDGYSDGGHLGASDFSQIVRHQIHVRLWTAVSIRRERGMTATDAVRSVRDETEKEIRDASLMNSTDPMANAVQVIEREARIAWSNQAAGLLAS